MGANDFFVVGFGKTAREAFHSAIGEAQYEHGHGGYTGTIAEKSSFVMIEDTWKDLKARYPKMIEGLAAIIKWFSQTPAKDFKTEHVTGALRAIEVSIWLPQGKLAILEELRKRMKRLREERDACKRSLPLEDIARKLLYTFNDSRVNDKWGPAGCIDLDPHLAGMRKEKRFLFFGRASS